MQEVDFASLTARETAPDPTSSECGADMELYMQDCRRLLALGIKRWSGDAPGRLGPRVLDPDEPRDLAMIEGMFAPQPEADGEADAGLQTPAQGALPLAPQSSSSGEAPALVVGSATDAPQPMEVEAPPGPAPTEAPPLLVPPSALHGLGLDGLVSQLKVLLATAPLDEAMVGHVLDGLEGLGLSGQALSGQALEDAGAPHTAHVPGVPAHLHRPPACPNGMPPLPCHQPSPSHGPAQARANWSTGCARSQECLRRSKRAPTGCTASGRRTGVRSSETICTRGVSVCVCVESCVSTCARECARTANIISSIGRCIER